MDVLRLEGEVADLERMADHFCEGVSLEKVGTAQRARFDNPCVHGAATSLDMHFGMNMVVTDLKGRVPLELAIEHAPTELEISFSRGRGCLAYGPDGQAIDMGGGAFRIGRISERTRFQWRAESGAVEQSVHLNLSVQNLRELLAVETLPQEILSVLGAAEPFSMTGHPMDGKMYEITDDILEFTNNPKASLGRNLFLQGKAMELVGLLCDRLMSDEAGPEVPGEDVPRLHRARDILVASLPEPPAVQDLARQVGMGERRLKNGFKAIFGAPVMTYARQMRMERARDLLVDRRHNVTEVARLVGYANPSKFAAAYKRQFGMSPTGA